MSKQELNQDIDALLDGTLDDLADMPSFKPFTAGMHKAVLKIEVKKIGTNTGAELGFKLIETLEQTDPAAEPTNPGDETNVLMFLKHPNEKTVELGQGQFKEVMKAGAEKFGPKSNRELIEEMNGTEVIIVTGVREDKTKGKSYTSLNSLMYE